MQYYYVCPKKLWLHAHGIGFEQESDKVLQGKVLHERSYPLMKKKDLLINDLIALDLYEEYVGEVKSSSKMIQADRMQLLYYLYVLKGMGINKEGKIHYPKEKKIEEVVLTEDYEKELESTLIDIERIKSSQTAPPTKKLRYCTKCAYHPFCWVGEEE